ncbi:MAG: hypothetical protein ACI9LY_002418 [Arenicella sp.]|jgi:uncharacterized protein (TIGR00255 family)
MPHSMTGFARAEEQHAWGAITCEIRSVNHRYLEPSFRLPESLRAIENDLRNTLKKTLARGKIDVSIQLKVEQNQESELKINQELLAQVKNLAEDVQQSLSSPAPINPLELLQWPGLLQRSEIAAETLHAAALALFQGNLKDLIDSRDREGTELGNFIEQRLDAIAEHVTELHKILPEILAQHQSKLREKLDALVADIDEDRLTQELVHVAQKSDVAEELDRLEAHLTEVRRTLAQKGPVGRRLDFLMQELNREANTLSSKSMASDTTQRAVDLKVLIEQMREQIQNIE